MVEKTEKQYVSNNTQLMSEWDWERNNKLGFDPQTITWVSNKKVWWICKKGHYWAEIVNNRTRRTSGCPYCSNHRVLSGFNDLETEHPEVAAEWNYDKNTILPNVVLSGSNKKYWWRCQRGHEWEASVTNRVYKKTGCPICSRERSISLPEKTLFFYLKDYFSDIQEQASFYWLAPREIDIFIPSLNLGIEYDGQYWHTDVDSDKEKRIYANNMK